MAESEDAQQQEPPAAADSQPAAPRAKGQMKKRLGFGLLFTSIAGGVGGLFYYGIVHLTQPSQTMDEALADRLAQTKSYGAEQKDPVPDNMSADVPAEAAADLDGDGIADFNGPAYRYFSFQAPFLSNLAESRKLLTLELGVSIKRPSFFVDGELETLIKLEPALRSQILGYLITLRPEQLVTREDRVMLAQNIRTLLNRYLRPDNDTDSLGIYEVQILKLVVA